MQCTDPHVIVSYVQFGDYLKSGKQNCICHTEGIFEGFHNNRVFIHLCLRAHLATKHQNGSHFNFGFQAQRCIE